jgi:cytochrome c-type biogenesis protein CcmH
VQLKIQKALLALCILLAFPTSATLALDLPAPQEARAQRVFEIVFSPFCPGRLLRDCPTSKAHDLKEEIRLFISQGKNDTEIINALVERYGNSIKALPEGHGFGLVAWVTPFLFVFIGIVLLALWLRRTKSAATPKHPSESQTISPETLKKIEKEMSA